MPPDFSIEPAEIPAYSVIRAAYRFGDESRLRSRLFVCLGHVEGHVLCLKVTSRVEKYQKRSDLRAGVVYYSHGEVDCFDKDTVVQPGNQILIPHDTLKAQRGSGDHYVEGTLPDAFPEKLAKAIGASVTMSPHQKNRLTSFLGF